MRTSTVVLVLSVLAGVLLGTCAQERTPTGRIVAFSPTPEYVGRRLKEKEAEIAAEVPIEGLSRRLSYYLRTRLPQLAVVTRDEATAEILRFVTAELGQPSPFVCFGDFDGDGLEDTAVVVREEATHRFDIMAFHQIHVVSNPGDHRSRDYRGHTIFRGGASAPGTKLDTLMIACQEPGRFESFEGGVTLILENHSIIIGFSVYYFVDNKYRSLGIAD